ERLIIDEGARAAVGELNAPQDELVFGRHVVFRHDGARRVPGREFEGRRHLPLLGALAYQDSIAARPERKREGIEQDGFAGARLSGEHGQAGRKVDIEPVDQDNVVSGSGIGRLTTTRCGALQVGWSPLAVSSPPDTGEAI